LGLRELLFAIALVPLSVNQHALGSETSQKFESMLDEACKAQESPEMCSCYAKRVTAEYNDEELVSIYNLLKDQEANNMFLVVHGKVGRSCKETIAE